MVLRRQILRMFLLHLLEAHDLTIHNINWKIHQLKTKHFIFKFWNVGGTTVRTISRTGQAIMFILMDPKIQLQQWKAPSGRTSTSGGSSSGPGGRTPAASRSSRAPSNVGSRPDGTAKMQIWKKYVERTGVLI